MRGGQRVRDRQYGPSQNATGSKRLQQLLRTPRRLITAQKARSHRSKAEGAASLAVSQLFYNPPDQQAAWKPQPRWRPRPHEMQSRLFIHPLSEQMKPKCAKSVFFSCGTRVPTAQQAGRALAAGGLPAWLTNPTPELQEKRPT